MELRDRDIPSPISAAFSRRRIWSEFLEKEIGKGRKWRNFSWFFIFIFSNGDLRDFNAAATAANLI